MKQKDKNKVKELTSNHVLIKFCLLMSKLVNVDEFDDEDAVVDNGTNDVAMNVTMQGTIFT